MAAVKPIVIVIDGIIGAGKTTLINGLVPQLTTRGYTVTVIREPVELWQEYLAKFYEDPARYSYLFQTTANHDRVIEGKTKYNENKYTSNVFIAERSVFSDTIFMRMLLDQGHCSQLEYQSYIKWWKMWADVVPFAPDMFIYLKPTITEAMRRVAIRARDGESLVSQDYQVQLGEYHDRIFSKSQVDLADFLPEARNSSLVVPVYRLETNEDFLNDDDVMSKIANYVEEKIKELRR